MEAGRRPEILTTLDYTANPVLIKKERRKNKRKRRGEERGKGRKGGGTSLTGRMR